MQFVKITSRLFAIFGITLWNMSYVLNAQVSYMRESYTSSFDLELYYFTPRMFLYFDILHTYLEIIHGIDFDDHYNKPHYFPALFYKYTGA